MSNERMKNFEKLENSLQNLIDTQVDPEIIVRATKCLIKVRETKEAVEGLKLSITQAKEKVDGVFKEATKNQKSPSDVS